MMNPEVKKGVYLTLGAITLIICGAIGMFAASKIIASPTTTVASNNPVANGAGNSPTTVTVANNSVPANIQGTQVAMNDGSPSAVVTVSNNNEPIYAMAEVLKVRPHLVLKSVAYRDCRDVPRTIFVDGGSPSGAGAVIGGVAGGIAGNQIGRGNGNIAATIGGTIVGAVVGNEMERNASRPRPQTVYVTECRTRYTKRAVQQGYEVTYLYNGKKGMTIMKQAPTGNTIPVPV